MAAKNIKGIKILGIDTSCDDTAISVMEIRNSKFEIRSNVVSSQVKLHQKYGGVYPSLAKREHQKNLPVVFRKALRQAQGKPNDIDFIGVTNGPGLEPCLWQGINFAKDLAERLKKPIVPVNHIEAHILANLINRRPPSIMFPVVALVVSGGHTQLILMRGIGKYKLIGETRDDAAGECFDKTARILGLSYPGGPAIAKIASLGNLVSKKETKFPVSLPRPMMHQKNYDFSFSGLKTAVLYKARELKTINYKLKTELCAEIQQAIIDVLLYKTIKAAKNYKARSIILGGGVAANDELRKQFKFKIKNLKFKINFFVPGRIYCTDNAAMVAITAFYHRTQKVKNIKAQADLQI